MWRRVAESLALRIAPSNEPWYRRPDVWLLVGAILLPFGWVLALGRVAWSQAAARRERKKQGDRFSATLASPEQNQRA